MKFCIHQMRHGGELGDYACLISQGNSNRTCPYLLGNVRKQGTSFLVERQTSDGRKETCEHFQPTKEFVSEFL